MGSGVASNGQAYSPEAIAPNSANPRSSLGSKIATNPSINNPAIHPIVRGSTTADTIISSLSLAHSFRHQALDITLRQQNQHPMIMFRIIYINQALQANISRKNISRKNISRKNISRKISQEKYLKKTVKSIES
jgi:hypothetical protein